MEIVNCNGKTYFVPATDLEQTGNITNFFEVGTSIYSVL